MEFKNDQPDIRVEKIMRNYFSLLFRKAGKWHSFAFTLIISLVFIVACSCKHQPDPSSAYIPVNVTGDMKNPLSDQKKAASAGQPLYAIHCAFCHGKDGMTAETSLGTFPTNLTGENVVSASDGKLFLSIKNGVRENGKITMPPAQNVTDEQIWQIVAYVRTLAQK